MQEVGRELGVAYVLEGSVRKAGARVRVTGQLINSKDGNHVWADRFDRELTDIFAIQDEITHAIVEQLKVKLLSSRAEVYRQAPTDNIEAHTYYLKGRHFLNRRSKRYTSIGAANVRQGGRAGPDVCPRLRPEWLIAIPYLLHDLSREGRDGEGSGHDREALRARP